ncbi:hypothetical protein LDENG_00166200 [Lucifuga dentata]|nr:hypothetical protein LDENG_00166200 [Lucifuga dentata]
MRNTSSIVVFSLSGFSATVNYRGTFFFLTLLAYCVILFVNLSLILAIILDKNFHEPMYIFLCNLCINGLYGTAAFYPKFLFDLLSDFHVISYVGCLLQIYVISSYTCNELTILSIMAFDRYTAVCQPLHYHSKMTTKTVVKLAVFALVCPSFCPVLFICLTSRLPLCGNKIQKVFCANWNVLKLSCVTTGVNSNLSMLLTIPTLCLPFSYVLYTYLRILAVCWKSSSEFKGKVLQSCLPHIVSFAIYSITGLCDIVLSRYDLEEINPFVTVILSLEFVVIPPVLNPLVYGLKLPDIRKHIDRYFKDIIMKTSKAIILTY